MGSARRCGCAPSRPVLLTRRVCLFGVRRAQQQQQQYESNLSQQQQQQAAPYGRMPGFGAAAESAGGFLRQVSFRTGNWGRQQPAFGRGNAAPPPSSFAASAFASSASTAMGGGGGPPFTGSIYGAAPPRSAAVDDGKARNNSLVSSHL
jgi:hypothetical protein